MPEQEKPRLGFRDEYMSRADFADELGVHERTVARYQNEPDGLPHVKIGGKDYIPIRQGREWIARRITQPNPTRGAA